MNVITLTLNPAVDISSRTDEVEPNCKLRCKTPRYDPGGGGINVSAVIKELGEKSTALFPCGGPAGRRLISLIKERGIQCRPIEIKNPTRSNLSIRDDSSGKQFRFVMPGAELDSEEIETGLNTLWSMDPTPDILVISGSLPPGVPPDVMTRIANESRRRDVRLIVDASGEALNKAAGAGVFLLKPNQKEAEDLTGRKMDSPEDRDSALTELMEQTDCEAVVLSMGHKGVCLATREGTECLPAPDVEVKSQTGAGDSMVGGIVAGLCRGDSLRDAVRLGIAAGSAAVMTAGTKLCQRRDVEVLLKDRK
jgi:6-phosphofructokinase 2